MAKLNKGEALEAMVNRLAADNEVASAEPQHLRLMDHQQLRDSAYRLVSIRHQWLVSNTFPKYQADVIYHGVKYILQGWRNRVSDFEANDPTIQAEYAALGFIHTVDYMITDALETLARFKKNFEENPAYAFQSTAAVQAAGNLEIATRAKNALTTHSPTEVKAALTTQLKYTFRIDGSTCPMSNLVERAKQVAIAKLVGLN